MSFGTHRPPGPGGAASPPVLNPLQLPQTRAPHPCPGTALPSLRSPRQGNRTLQTQSFPAYCQLPPLPEDVAQAAPSRVPLSHLPEGPSNFPEAPSATPLPAPSTWRLAEGRVPLKSLSVPGLRGQRPPGTSGSPATQSYRPLTLPVRGMKDEVTCPAGKGPQLPSPLCGQEIRLGGNREDGVVLHSANSEQGQPEGPGRGLQPRPRALWETSRQCTLLCPGSETSEAGTGASHTCYLI